MNPKKEDHHQLLKDDNNNCEEERKRKVADGGGGSEEKEEPTTKREKKEPKLKLKAVMKEDWLKLRETFLMNHEQRLKQLKAECERLRELLNSRREQKIKEENRRIKTDDITRGAILKVDVDINNEAEYALFKLTRQQFKDKFVVPAQLTDQIVYVDLDKASNRIYLRCKTKECADFVLDSAKDFLAQMRKSRLSVNEEDEYFGKIFKNRNKKLAKKEKKQEIESSSSTSTTAATVASNKQEEEKKPIIKNNNEPLKSKHIKFEDD